VADAFGLAVTAWAPLGGGVLTGKYTRGSTESPEDSKRAASNQGRLTARNVQIAREVDAVADELGTTSVQVATAWVRQRGHRVIPIVGVRKLEQLQDVLGSLDVELPADQRSRLDKASRIEFGFPYNLLSGPEGQMVYGDLEPKIDLPAAAPYRWQT
jgi:aryl-alcohol dehydrogenase-like predicted oxidoreductase